MRQVVHLFTDYAGGGNKIEFNRFDYDLLHLLLFRCNYNRCVNYTPLPRFPLLCVSSVWSETDELMLLLTWPRPSVATLSSLGAAFTAIICLISPKYTGGVYISNCVFAIVIAEINVIISNIPFYWIVLQSISEWQPGAYIAKLAITLLGYAIINRKEGAATDTHSLTPLHVRPSEEASNNCNLLNITDNLSFPCVDDVVQAIKPILLL